MLVWCVEPGSQQLLAGSSQCDSGMFKEHGTWLGLKDLEIEDITGLVLRHGLCTGDQLC